MASSKDKRGLKRVCGSCGTHFYDFRKSPVLCPQCGVEFSLGTKRSGKGLAEEEAKPEPEKKDVEADINIDVEVDEGVLPGSDR